MKNYSILRKFSAILAMSIVWAIALPLIACDKEIKPTDMIKMTTRASKVEIGLLGTGDIVIDWGDGRISNMNDAASFDELSGCFTFTQNYSRADKRNIVITGNVRGCQEITIPI